MVSMYEDPPDLPFVRCAVCDKPVDEVRSWWDESKMEWALKVYCHGQTDEMRIPTRGLQDKTLHDALKEAMTRGGVAFQRKGIEDARPDETPAALPRL